MKIIIFYLSVFSCFFSFSQSDTISTIKKDTLFNGIISFKDWDEAHFLMSTITDKGKIISIQIEGTAGEDSMNKLFKIKDLNPKKDNSISLSENTDDLIKVTLLKGFSKEGGIISLDIKMRNRKPPKEIVYIRKNNLGNFKAYLSKSLSENEIDNIFIRLKAGWWLFWIKTEYYKINFIDKSTKVVIDK